MDKLTSRWKKLVDTVRSTAQQERADLAPVVKPPIRDAEAPVAIENTAPPLQEKKDLLEGYSFAAFSQRSDSETSDNVENKFGARKSFTYLIEGIQDTPDSKEVTAHIERVLDKSVSAWEETISIEDATKEIQTLINEILLSLQTTNLEGYSKLTLARTILAGGKKTLVVASIGDAPALIIRKDGKADRLIKPSEIRRNAVGKTKDISSVEPKIVSYPITNDDLGVVIVSSTFEADPQLLLHLTDLNLKQEEMKNTAEKIVKKQIETLKPNVKNPQEFTASYLKITDQEMSTDELRAFLNLENIPTFTQLMVKLDEIKKYDLGKSISGVISTDASRPAEEILGILRSINQEFLSKESQVNRAAKGIPLTEIDNKAKIESMVHMYFDAQLAAITSNYELRTTVTALLVDKFIQTKNESVPGL